MKKIITLICCLLPVFSYADPRQDNESTLSPYQELCAKEQDPIKRHRYCYILHHSEQKNAILSELRQDRVIA